MARYVRVSSISFGGAGTSDNKVESNRKAAMELIEQAACDKPDIVCLPETFASLGLSEKEWFQTAEPVPGPTTEAIGELARKHNMYIVCPMVERKGDKVHNSAVIIDRQGNPIGSYHKIHPTIEEIEVGITPGTEPKVFQTDFGCIGCAICFDLNFRDVIEGLSKNGVEIVFFPSMYRGGLQLSIWAHDFGIFIVSAYTGAGSAIVNPLGKVLIQSDIHNSIISQSINLDYEVFHIDYNSAKWGELKSKYGPEVEIEVAGPEAAFTLTSHLPNISVEDLITEFQLEPRDAYFRRATQIRLNALGGT